MVTIDFFTRHYTRDERCERYEWLNENNFQFHVTTGGDMIIYVDKEALMFQLRWGS